MTVEQKTIRAGLVGCGAIAQKALIPGFLPSDHPRRIRPPHFLDFGGSEGLQIVAVSDTDSERLGAAQAILGAQAFADASLMMDTVHLDALIIAVPNRLHAQLTTQALSRGLDVFVEKPLATSAAQLDEVVKALSSSDRLAVTHLPWLYAGLTRELIEQSKRLDSPIDEIDATFCHSGPSQTWSSSASWYREPSENPGGCVSDLGIHLFSIIAELAGPHSLELKSCRGRLAGGVPEHAEWAVSAGATRIRARVGWTSPGPLFKVRVSSAGRLLQLNLTGDKKGLYAGADEASLDAAIAAQAHLPPVGVQSVVSPYADFTRAVHTRAEPLSSARRMIEIERLLLRSVVEAEGGVAAHHFSSGNRTSWGVASSANTES